MLVAKYGYSCKALPFFVSIVRIFQKEILAKTRRIGLKTGIL